MNDDDSGPQLDPRVLAILKEDEKPPEGARRRARSRLSVLVPMGTTPGTTPSGGAGSSGAGASGASGATQAALGTHGVTLLALLVGGVMGAGIHAVFAPPPSARVVFVPSPPPPPMVTTAAVAADIPKPSTPASSPAAPPAEEARAVAPPPVRPAAPASTRSSQLAAERALLDEARAAIGQGNAEGALARLDDSRRAFPAPIMDEERQALTVEALVAAHRPADARLAADAFRRRFPGSLFTPTVEGAIRSIQ